LHPTAAQPGPAPRSAPPSWLAWGIALLGLTALYAPTLRDLALIIWSTEEQRHGWVVLMLCLWLFWRQRATLAPLPGEGDTTRSTAGWLLLGLAAVSVVLGPLLVVYAG